MAGDLPGVTRNERLAREMPDVTPKTESGRALLDFLCIPLTSQRDVDARRADILAIEQEAASKAVAEYRRVLGDFIAHHEVVRVSGGGHVRPNRCEFVEQARALIASERKPTPSDPSEPPTPR